MLASAQCRMLCCRGCWLLVRLIDMTRRSRIQVPHQSVARQKCKLVADFGVQMHLAWAQHFDNRELANVDGNSQV